MPMTPGSVEHLSEISSHVLAPAFLLGAMASFVSILTTRMSTLQDRIREVGRTEGDDHVIGHVKIDIPHLRRRMNPLHSAFILTIARGVVSCILITGATAVALAGYRHVGFAAFPFMISMCLLFVALLIRSVEVGTEHAYPLT